MVLGSKGVEFSWLTYVKRTSSTFGMRSWKGDIFDGQSSNGSFTGWPSSLYISLAFTFHRPNFVTRLSDSLQDLSSENHLSEHLFVDTHLFQNRTMDTDTTPFATLFFGGLFNIRHTLMINGFQQVFFLMVFRYPRFLSLKKASDIFKKNEMASPGGMFLWVFFMTIPSLKLTNGTWK